MKHSVNFNHFLGEKVCSMPAKKGRFMSFELIRKNIVIFLIKSSHWIRTAARKWHESVNDVIIQMQTEHLLVVKLLYIDVKIVVPDVMRDI